MDWKKNVWKSYNVQILFSNESLVLNDDDASSFPDSKSKCVVLNKLIDKKFWCFFFRKWAHQSRSPMFTLLCVRAYFFFTTNNIQNKRNRRFYLNEHYVSVCDIPSEYYLLYVSVCCVEISCSSLTFFGGMVSGIESDVM